MGSCVAAFVHAIYTVTSHMGRIVGQSQFEQPLFMDVLTQSLGPIVGHGFITSFCIVGISYLICNNLAFIQNFKEGLSGLLIRFHVDSQSAVLVACVSVNFIVCLIIPNALNVLIFFRSKEFKKLASSAKSVLVRH